MTKCWSENENIGYWVFNRAFKSRNTVECSIGGIKLKGESRNCTCLSIVCRCVARLKWHVWILSCVWGNIQSKPFGALIFVGAVSVEAFPDISKRWLGHFVWNVDRGWIVPWWTQTHFYRIFKFRLLLLYHLFWNKLSFKNKGGHLNIFTEIKDCKLNSSKLNV